VKGRLADLPLEERRAQEIEKRRELDEGLTRRHLANAAYEQAYRDVQFDRVLRAGRAKLRED
jgi:hypothetical protein